MAKNYRKYMTKIRVSSSGIFFDSNFNIWLAAKDWHCPAELLDAVKHALNDEDYDELDYPAKIKNHLHKDGCISIEYGRSSFDFSLRGAKIRFSEFGFSFEDAEEYEEAFAEDLVKKFKQHIKGAM